MAPDALTNLLVDVCLDVDRLDEVREDPDAALAAAGVPPHLAELVGRRRGSWISAAVTLSRPMPPAEDIEAFARARAAEDPAFAEAIRREAGPILQRALQVRFPRGTTIDVIEVDGLPEVRITGLRPATAQTMDFTAPLEIEAQSDVDIDTDIDTDVDIDTDIDVDIDTGVIDVDVDVDVDIDVDTVVDNVVDNVTATNAGPRAERDWDRFWDRRRTAWRAADDRTTD